MKRTVKSPVDPPSLSSPPALAPLLAPLLAFGAHPDDIEFGCGGVIIKETLGGRAAHVVVCSRGEAASHGTPARRVREARRGAEIMGGALQWVDLGGDAHFEVNVANTIKIARVIRRVRPGIVLCPSLVENQHPDHAALGRMVRDGARLARYGGLAELRGIKPHVIQQLFHFATTPQAEPVDVTAVLVDVSDEEIMERWTAAMGAHATQVSARGYVEMQLTRARLRGLSAGVGYAIALFPSDAIVVDSLSQVSRGARGF
ncbi:MAG: PIG-L family deacetylase [Tepidisphaeraceae bacterium]|jgi:LmbE family N-acetylglucosaminyl deacetylase